MRRLIAWFTATNTNGKRVDFGLLLLRLLGGGFLAALHGWGKLTTFGTRLETFSDPLGIGSALSLTLTVFAEFFCSLAVVLGLFTRGAVLPLLVMFLIIVTVVHADDPWNKKEFALLYAFPFLTLLFTGAGRYSLDAKFFRRA